MTQLSLQQWLIAWLGGLAAGALAWWLTDDPWLGLAGTVLAIAGYTFLLAGRTQRPAPAAAPPNRQARRYAERQRQKAKRG